MTERTTTKRLSLRIPAEVQEAPKHPDYLGLPADTSMSKVYERLLVLGWRTARKQRAAKEELALYAEYERDPERIDAARAIQRMTLRSGVV